MGTRTFHYVGRAQFIDATTTGN